jgi:Kef-type K+ transport system membrane component KefB
MINTLYFYLYLLLNDKFKDNDPVNKSIVIIGICYGFLLKFILNLFLSLMNEHKCAFYLSVNYSFTITILIIIIFFLYFYNGKRYSFIVKEQREINKLHMFCSILFFVICISCSFSDKLILDIYFKNGQ